MGFQLYGLDVIFALIAAFLPAFVWFWFFLKEDDHPEPKRLLARVFGFGALMSVPAFILQLGSQKLFGFGGHRDILIFAFFAIIEETLKFIAAYSVVKNNPEFDEPVDAMIYMIASALGFATIENLLIAINILLTTDSPLSALAGVLAFRFVGATLMHALGSGTIGYFWAKTGMGKIKIQSVVVGFTIVVAVHATFNSLVMTFQKISLIIPTLFLVVFALFVLKLFEKVKQ